MGMIFVIFHRLELEAIDLAVSAYRDHARRETYVEGGEHLGGGEVEMRWR